MQCPQRRSDDRQYNPERVMTVKEWGQNGIICTEHQTDEVDRSERIYRYCEGTLITAQERVK